MTRILNVRAWRPFASAGSRGRSGRIGIMAAVLLLVSGAAIAPLFAMAGATELAGQAPAMPQTTVVLTPVADTTISGLEPETNLNSQHSLSVYWVDDSPDAPMRALIRFNLAAAVPPEAVIDSATLDLNLTAWENDGPVDVRARNVFSDWIESEVTWASRPEAGDPAMVTAVEAGEGRKTLDVTEIVQAWHNVPHYGLELSGPEGPPNYERSFDSRETDSPPELAVTYHVPPPPEYTFSGHAYLGEPPNRETPLDGAEVALYGDVDEWPGNGTGVYLAGAITERAGAFTLAWQGEPFPFYHVVNTGAPGTHVAGAQAEPPGTVTSASTVTYAELQPGEVGSIAFWNRPLPEGCQEWLRNGGFQRGSLLPWRSDGAAGLGSGREDEYGAWLGGQDSITAELFQLVTLPVGADPMLLTFWWMAESEIEQLGDVLRVLIQYDEQADRLLELPATGPRGEWRYAAVDLGAYAGRPIWVTFQAQTDAEVPTTFRVDDVSLLACGAEPPNLVVTDVWSQGSLPCYQIRNVGAGWAPGGHWTGLLIDGVQVAGEWVDLELEPGERWSHCFDYEWACTAPDDPVMAWADHGERVIEADEADNRREETWRCDTAPPTIVDGPAVSEITSSSALITWQTDEQSDGVVHYGTTAGRFPLEASDPTPLQSHAIPLTGLQPATVYRLKVRSTDAGGNSVESEERTFQTLPEADGQDPGVWLVDPGQWRDSVLVEAEASDNRGVEKVEFSLDGELVFIDYSPPYQFALDTALYENGQHGLAATAFDLSGRSDTDDLQADFANLVDQSAPAITITAPSQDETVSGKVNVVAQLSDDKGLAYAYFWVNGEFEAFEPLPSKPKNVTLTFEWDTTVMTQTKARLAVEAYDVEFKYGVATRDVIVSQPAPPLPPKLKVTQHKVTRSQNYVEVDLTVTNVGQGTAKNVTVQDFLRGFQPISDGTTAPSQVEYLAGFTASTRWWDCAIVDQGDLLAGASRTYRYTAIPVMVYPNPPVASVGEMVKLFYEDTGGKEYGETVKFPVSHTTANVPIATAHANALKSATYLLVTNPQRLFWYHVKAQQVDDLLSAMAELAYYKDGALGYLYTHDKYVLDALIEPLNPLLLGTYGDNWAFRLHPDFSKLLGGSVLIVGETEIVPAWEQGGFSIGWNPVKYSDQPYADTGGSPAPELLVGRIVGDSATTMIKPIQASIGVYTGASGYGFDHDRATLISGPGFGSFIQDVEDVAPILSNKGVAVSKAHNRDYFHISSFGRPFQEGDGFAVGDANGGADEIIVAEQSSDSIYVYRFDPVASAWTLLASFYGGYGGHEFEASDKIAAGDAMIVMADASADRILIYTGLGADSTSFPVTFDAGDGLALGDVTGDGNLEVVIADHSADKVLFYTPAGTKLANEVAYPLEAKDHLAVGDILGQGFAEEIVIADRSTNQILIYALNGTLQGSKQFGTVPVGGKTLNWLEYIDYDVSAQQDVGGSALAAGNLYPWPSGNNSGKEEILLAPARNYQHIRVYWWDAATGELRETAPIPFDFDEFEGLATGDVGIFSGSLQDEVFVADRANYLRLYDTNNWRTRFHTALPGYTQDADLLFLSGHGNVDGCCGLSSYSDPIFPLDFNDHNPVVLVTSCLTGNYQDNADSKNFAESFLNSGAAIYIGATQSSSGYQNREAAKWLYKNWDAGEPIGKVFTELERTYWKGSQTDDWWFWAYEQNLYGDPQFGATTLGTVQAPDAAALSSSTLQIEVPGYVVSHTLGLDWVTIPGGRLWMAPGQLWLPYYSTSMEVPAGTKVQDVVLTNRSGGMTDSGFNLPMVPLTVTACACTPEPYAGPVEGWFPERVYDWATLDNPDGTTTLEVAVYPFYYNPLTSDVLFFSNYAFEVITTASEVRVTGLATDKPEYQPGEPVLAEVELENAGYTQDVFVSALVKHYGSEEVVGGLLLESLIGLRGASSFSMEWDSSSAEPGTYLIEVTLEDAGGTLLDRSTELFGLGTVGGAITGFQAEPGHFAIGQSINLSLTFENTGTVPVMGTAVIQVRNEADDTVQEFSHEIANLAPGASAALEDAWDTSEAGEGTYRIVAHVAYDSTATDPAVAIVSTHSRLYLPLVVRSAGP